MGTYSTTLGGLELRDVNQALYAGVDANDRELVIAGDRFILPFNKAADAMASTATAEFALGAVPRAYAAGSSNRAWNLVGLVYTPAAAVTASDTDFATITVAYRTSAGAAGATIGTFVTNTTGTGSWVQWAPVNGTLSTTPATTAGASLTCTITKTGSGVVVPAGVLQLVFAVA